MFFAEPSVQGEEIWPRVGGGSVECAGIINCDGEVFSLAVWAGVNGEISGRARSERSGLSLSLQG